MFYQIWTTPVSFLFTEWSLEVIGCTTDIASISCSDLDQDWENAMLRPLQNQIKTGLSKWQLNKQANEYTKNPFKSIRSAINRQFQDLGRDIDIVRGKEFRASNNILDGKLKKNLQEY